MKKIVVFSGAGVSADSGIPTYRSADGLWANYRIEEVCTPEALARDREKVIRFYNERRREMLSKEPNAGHIAIAELERYFNVAVVTQNIDDLHERAGSTDVTHLHGELVKLRSTANPELTVGIDGWEQHPQDCAPDGSPLRPHIVFFGEAVPMFDTAARIVASADIFIIAGTSLAVYPAASLVGYVRDRQVPVYIVDPGEPDIAFVRNSVTHIKAPSAVGMPELARRLIKEYAQE